MLPTTPGYACPLPGPLPARPGPALTSESLMRHKALGRTDLFVSELCLGIMNFGGSSGI